MACHIPISNFPLITLLDNSNRNSDRNSDIIPSYQNILTKIKNNINIIDSSNNCKAFCSSK